MGDPTKYTVATFSELIADVTIQNLFFHPLNNDTHARGKPYVQLFHKYPDLEPYYTAYEKRFNCEPIYQLMMYGNIKEIDMSFVPIGFVIAYCLMIIFVPMIMKSHDKIDEKTKKVIKFKFDLKPQMALWNLALSLFSFWGASRTVPHLLNRLATKTFEETICDDALYSYGAGACGFAVQMFVLSKIPELVDTVFIVLRRSKLIFLHWYHHITVLLFCWNSYISESGAGLYFASMNYTVHAIMYLYFFLTTYKLVPKWFPPILITVIQITQMIIGTGIVCSCLYFYKFGGTKYGPGQCNNKESNLIAGGLMYASYLYLFCEFMVRRFLLGDTKAADRYSGKDSSSTLELDKLAKKDK